MIFHHCFGLYALPVGVDTTWIAPWITHYAASFKICVAIFLFITGYAMGWKTSPSPSFGSLVKTGFFHYFKFWKIYILCFFLVILSSWFFPVPGLPSPSNLDWRDWLLSITGLQPSYIDWWYMSAFAVVSIVLYPICSWIAHRALPLVTLSALLGLSLLFRKTAFITAFIPEMPFNWSEVAHFTPCFILGYMCAFLASRSPSFSPLTYWGAVLILTLEILSIHFFSFSHDKTWTLPFLFTLWCLPWLTNKLHLTGLLTLLGTYSALMWLSHRFIFGYHFSWTLYGTHSYLMIYGITILGSLILAISLQWIINQIFHLSHPSR